MQSYSESQQHVYYFQAELPERTDSGNFNGTLHRRSPPDHYIQSILQNDVRSRVMAVGSLQQ